MLSRLVKKMPTKQGTSLPFIHRVHRFCSTENSEDEEFMFPIHFTIGDRDIFAWSVDQITRNEDFSIAADNFGPSREIIYSSKAMKIMKVDHTVHGVSTFGLAKDDFDKWKITSIYNFNTILESLTPQTIAPYLDRFLTACNTPGDHAREMLTVPYHLIVPPHALHIREFFTKMIKFPANTTFAWNTPPSVLLMSENKCLLEGKIDVHVDENKEEYDMVMLMLRQPEQLWKIGSLGLSKT